MKSNFLNPIAAAGLLMMLGTVGTNAADILTFASPWEFLVHKDAGNNQIDPATEDADFYDTWYLPTGNPGYNGPAFSPPTAGPFGYGTIDYFTNNGITPSSLGAVPTSGTRGTAYFKTTFDLGANALSDVGLEILSDDGFILFLDGNLVTPYATYNMDVLSTQWNAFAHDFQDINGINMESQTFSFGSAFGTPLADIGPGVHTLAMSVHQANAGSSDLGLAFRLSGTLTPVPEPAATGTALLVLAAALRRRRRA